VGLDHKIVGFDQFLVCEDIFVFEAVVLKEGVDGNIGIDSLGGLVSYSEQKEEYVFEVDDADHHS